jgi:hypothetical protein
VFDLMEKVALAARYADVVTVLKDSARFSADRVSHPGAECTAEYGHVLVRWVPMRV